MAEISVHRRERPSGNVPVALSWADRLFNELMPSRVFLELMPSMMKDRGELMPEERQFGSFSRSFMLPADVKEDGIEASYKGGVLRVNIPKSERAKQKKIPVKMN